MARAAAGAPAGAQPQPGVGRQSRRRRRRTGQGPPARRFPASRRSSWLIRTSASATAASFAAGWSRSGWAEHGAGAAAPDQAVRQRQVQRRQVHRKVRRAVGRRAARTEGDHRAERGVVGHPHAELARPADLALHQQAGRGPRVAVAAAVSRAPGLARQQQPRGDLDLVGVVQVQGDCARAGARRAAPAGAASPPRGSRAGRLPPAASSAPGDVAGGDGGDAVGGQHVERLVLDTAPAGRSAAPGRTSGARRCGRGRRTAPRWAAVRGRRRGCGGRAPGAGSRAPPGPGWRTPAGRPSPARRGAGRRWFRPWRRPAAARAAVRTAGERLR